MRRLSRVTRGPSEDHVTTFGLPFVKRFALCYRFAVCPVLSVCLSCLSVCNVRALQPNSWTDQDETWHEGAPRPWPHCVRWDLAPPPPKRHIPQFSVHISSARMAACIKMSLGMELGLGPGNFVRWEPRSPPQKGVEPPNFRSMFIVAKRLDG